VSNLFIVIPTEIIMFSGLAYLLLPQIPFLSKALAFVLEHTILIMNKFLAWTEHLPFASIGKIWLTATEYLLLYVVIISLFYFFYNKKAVLLRLILVSMLLFCISISLKSINASRTDRIAWLNINKHKAIIFKHGNAAILLTDLKDTDKAYKYSVQPYLDSCAVSNLKPLALNQNINANWFSKSGGLIQFINERAFILNTLPADDEQPARLKTNFIYITTNPKAELAVINRNFNFNKMIIDGTNSDAYIKKLATAADCNKINYKILKRNISLLTVSN
jgi:competence protein ComEC